ncbi:Pro-apoptotic serine protease [Wickerhamomyces ciferrii]|uniref:Pro-apoptotic serine protease NMA111 n=1 Tax=Wickerhamomyces ciferrii (strain ATCC 14091 / BCRC 22168 / CBS 111 / JCM 3599 / NBRC 0793 / NRRL Y-1031 F-60-10) TaxID=1206466 RepID=K0KHT3_WICCF|nr:Pro-apoptotic serine protease [Wickerhamomyces ciferrii]CCH40949.1 Pro-apoptotic serine protease [Wickerhamomyces ciferrii]
MSTTNHKRNLSTENLNGSNKRVNLEGQQNQDISIDQDISIGSPDSTSNDIESIPVISEALTNGKWHDTINKVVKSVVSIHFAQTASFDCDPAIVSEATGFVVDSERGIILTNRHVVGAGPFWGYAIFDNHEEAVVKPIYRDPVHDFGFLKFDPKNIKYMEVQSLELKPDLAKVGTEIRVVGNDAGEKLSILAGFISRIDRNTPEYGGLTYNDFNTEYIQAAASASGGSSGSPVVNVDGYAVALQAGGSTEASTDFFLPVYRVLRALKCIQESLPVTRGTIQTQWMLRPFEECRRLGLSDEAEKRAREKFPEIIGLLVAEVILPEGPADQKIKEGDTLISINGIEISNFIKVDDILDSHVGEEVEIILQRGGEDIIVKCDVGNLHDITLSRYLEVGGASFNDMSYQMARIYAIPVKGVFINNATGSFFLDKQETTGWVIDTINDVDIPNLDKFIEVMKSIPDRSRVSMQFRHISDLHSPHNSTIYVDRHWCTSFRLATRNDETGLWDFTELGDALPPVPQSPRAVKFIDIPIDQPGCAQLSRSLVLVTSTIHIPVDAFPAIRKRQHGLVIDASKGLVIVSRNVVPHDCLDVHVVVAESVIIPARVKFLHPTQNFAIIQYDPSLIKTEVLTPKFSDVPLKRGDKATFVGYNYNSRVVTSETKVTDIASINVPRHVLSPRYRGSNLESVAFDTNLVSQCGSGVLADSDGTIRALWMSFLGEGGKDSDTIYKMGIDITELTPFIKDFTEGIDPIVKIVDAEFFGLSLVQARIRGVSDEWIEKIENSGKDRLQFLAVSRVSVPAVNQPKSNLEPGDIVLSIDNKPVYSITDITAKSTKNELNFKIVRRRQEIEVLVPTVEIKPTDHLVFWCGAVLQEPHHAVRQSMLNLPSQVYVTNRMQGSPARHYGISSTNFITHVNGIPTPTLDKFVEVVRQIGDNTYCKLRLVSFDNVPFAISIKTNYHYFPTGELKRDTKLNNWFDIEYDVKNKESKVSHI